MGLLSRLLKLLRARGSSPTLLTSRPILPPASGFDEQGWDGRDLFPLPSSLKASFLNEKCHKLICDKALIGRWTLNHSLTSAVNSRGLYSTALWSHIPHPQKYVAAWPQVSLKQEGDCIGLLCFRFMVNISQQIVFAQFLKIDSHSFNSQRK